MTHEEAKKMGATHYKYEKGKTRYFKIRFLLVFYWDDGWHRIDSDCYSVYWFFGWKYYHKYHNTTYDIKPL